MVWVVPVSHDQDQFKKVISSLSQPHHATRLCTAEGAPALATMWGILWQSHLSHKPTKRRVQGCGQTGPGGQGEGATHRRKGCRSLRGYSCGLCLSGLQTVMGSGQKWCRCPDKKTQVMEERKGEKWYQSYHKHICSFLRAGSGSWDHCCTGAWTQPGPRPRRPPEEKSRCGRTVAQPLLCSVAAVPLQLRQENWFSQIHL